jgi:hypothetical protein
MRTGYRPNVFRDENQKIYAINLGSEFCAEHEWGIADLWSMIKVDRNKLGIDGYRASVGGGTNMRSFKSKNIFYILFGNYFSHKDLEELKKDYKDGGRHLYMGEDQTFCGAWSQNDFGLAVKVKDEETYQFFKDLSDAINTGDFAL